MRMQVKTVTHPDEGAARGLVQIKHGEGDAVVQVGDGNV